MINDLTLFLDKVLHVLSIVSVFTIISSVFVLYYRLTNDGKIIKKRVVMTTQKKDCRGVIYGLKGHKIAYSPIEEENHVVCFGGTGSGKTYHVLKPTLRSWAKGTDTFFAWILWKETPKTAKKTTALLIVSIARIN